MSGRIKTRSWEDKSGVKKYTTEIMGSELQMLDSKSTNPSIDQSINVVKQTTNNNFDDEIPF